MQKFLPVWTVDAIQGVELTSYQSRLAEQPLPRIGRQFERHDFVDVTLAYCVV